MAARDPKQLSLGSVTANLVPDPDEANENYASNDIASGASQNIGNSPEEPYLGVYDEYPAYTTGECAATSAATPNKPGAYDGQTSDRLNANC